ncbi:collagen-like protein [Rhizobium tubonense]|uniref:collagen-like protein n=1 Tax=Rhizobium tubonense TaxID=484088 RepID=UPI000DAAD1F9|nr:collagen-like protein [Rhizobium tubonense]
MANQNRPLHEHVGLVSGALAIAGVIAGGAHYVDNLQNQLDNAKTAIIELRTKLDAAGVRGTKGDKGERGEQGEPGERGLPGQPGPKGADGQSADSSRIEQLSQQLAEMRQRLDGLSAGRAADPHPTSSNRNDTAPIALVAPVTLVGTWVGASSCTNLQFSITFVVKTQSGHSGAGSWKWNGSTSGTDDATISPMPTPDKPNSYMLVTADKNTYDYKVTLTGDQLDGMSNYGNCHLHLEKT